MLIVCPSCLSAYRMPPEATRSAAKAVRCAQCGGVFAPASAVSLPRVVGPAPGPTIPADILPVMRPVRPLPPPPPGTHAPRTGSAALMLLAIGLGLGMAGVAWRTQVALALPASAALFDAIGLPPAPHGLSLGTVETALADEGATKVLTLEGSITNARRTDADVPNLRIVVRDATEQTVYSWVTPSPRARIGPGETLPFRSRLVSPPPNGHDLVVSFADQSDGTAAEATTSR